MRAFRRICAAFLSSIPAVLCAQSAWINVSANNVVFGTTVTVEQSVSAAEGDVLFSNYAWFRRPDGSTGTTAYGDYLWVNSRTASGNVTLNQAGVWQFYAYGYTGDYPRTQQVIESAPFNVTVSHPPAPQITSPLEVTYAQRQWFNYQITATQSPTSFGASGLPAGLGFSTVSGLISGGVTQGGTYFPMISAQGGTGSTTATLRMNITAAQITPINSVNPRLLRVGETATLTRDGFTNFPFGFTQGTIWPPAGAPIEAERLYSLGTTYYTPDRGPGVYDWQYRLADTHGNHEDRWLKFYVGDVSPLNLTVNGGGTFDLKATVPAINFGQSVTITGSVNYPPGTMRAFHIAGYQGDNQWANYSYIPMSATATYAFNVPYQPSKRGSGTHSAWVYAWGDAPFDYWWMGAPFSLTVNKSTPVVSNWTNRSFPQGFIVHPNDLSANLSNPYSGTVVSPTGSVNYTLNGGPISAGTAVAPGSYTVRAAYPGDANYNAVNADVTWTVSNNAPTSSHAFLSSTPAKLGDSVSIRWSGSDVDSNLTQVHGRLRKPSGADAGWTSSGAFSARASYSYDQSIVVDQVGTWDLWGHADDAITGAHGSTHGTPDLSVVARAKMLLWLEYFGPNAPAAQATHTAQTTLGSFWSAPYDQNPTRGSINGHTYTVGQTVILRAVLNMPDGHAVSRRLLVKRPDGTVAIDNTASGAANASSTSVWNDNTLTLNQPGTYTIEITGAANWTAPNPASATVTYQLTTTNGAPAQVTHNVPSSMNLGASHAFTFSTSDGDGNLRSVLVHYRNLTTNSGWRLLRATDTVPDGAWGATLPTSADAFALAVNTSGNWSSHSVNRTWSPDAGSGNYEFHLRGIDQAGLESFRSVQMQVVVPPPTAPGGFTPSIVGSGYVTLSWTASTSPVGINRYAVYRTPAGGGEVWVANVAGNLTTYTDRTAQPGTAYTYRILAVDNQETAATSVTTSATTRLPLIVFSPL